MAYIPKVNKKIQEIAKAMNTNTNTTTKVDYNIDTNNLAGADNVRNAYGTVRGKQVDTNNPNTAINAVVGNPIKNKETGKTFVPEINKGDTVLPSDEQKKVMASIADDSNKRAQAVLDKVANNKVTNKIKETVGATKELFSALSESINNEKQKKAQDAFNKRNSNWNSASEEDRLTALSEDVKKNLDKATIDYQAVKGLVDISDPTKVSDEMRNKLAEAEENYNYWNRINELKEDYSALNEYDRLSKEGTKEEIDSFVETMSHEDDNMAQRAVNAGKHLIVETANIVPSAIDQMRGIGNYNYAQEQISQLDNLFNSGKIDEASYKENLKYWKDYIDKYDATNQDNLSQKIKSISNQIQQNTYYGASDVEAFVLEAGESTAQFLLHYAIGQGIASMVGGTSDFVGLAKSALGEEAKNWSMEALTQYGMDIAKNQIATTGAQIATISMSAVSATARTDELLKQGVDPQTAINNGMLTGITSYLTEKIGMDNFVNKVVGGAGEKVLGHLINSIGTQALAEGSEELVEGLIDPLIDSYTMGVPYEVDGNELLMSFLLGATSGGVMAIGGTAIGQHRLVVNNRQQFEKLNNEIKYLNSIKPSMSQEQQIEVDYWIRVGTNALSEYASKSKSLGVTFASDIQETTNAIQDEKTIIDSLVPNFNEEIDFNQKLNDARGTVLSVSQGLIDQKGLNMNAEEYYNLSEETRNKIDNFANKLTDEQRANTIFDYEKITKEDGKFQYAKDDINARYDGFYDPETGKTIINPLGNRTMESTFVHETLHSLENTYAYKKITDLVDKIFNDENDVKTFKDNIADLYRKAGKSLDEKTLNSEYYARRVQDLIGNEDFLKQLSNYDSNVFNRMFTDLMSKFKGEDSLINQLQNTFAKVYNEAQRTTANGEAQYSNSEYNKDISLDWDEKDRNYAKAMSASQVRGKKNGAYITRDTSNTFLIKKLSEDDVEILGYSKGENNGRLYRIRDILNSGDEENENIFNDYRRYYDVTRGERISTEKNDNLADENARFKQRSNRQNGNRTIGRSDLTYHKTFNNKFIVDGKEYSADELYEKFPFDIANEIELSDIGLVKTIKSIDNKFKYSISDIATNENGEKFNLTKEQVSKFKNTKVRDENGNIEVVYHSTPYNFEQFDAMKWNRAHHGSGNYFTNIKDVAENYRQTDSDGNVVVDSYDEQGRPIPVEGRTLEGLLNIENPLNADEKTITKEQLEKLIWDLESESANNGTSFIEERLYDYGDIKTLDGYQEAIDNLYNWVDNDVALVEELNYYLFRDKGSSSVDLNRFYEILREDTGKDGIIIEEPLYEYGKQAKYYIAFNSDQFKYLDNTNPTDSKDFRYSISEEDVNEKLNFSKQIKDELQSEISKVGGDLNKFDWKEIQKNKSLVDSLRELDKVANSWGSSSYEMTPERVALDENVANEYYRQITKEKSKNKIASIVIGPPASGKSTVISNQLKSDYNAVEIDSDKIKEMLPEFKKYGGLMANYVHDESSNIANEVEKEIINEGYNIVLPLVGKNEDKISDKIDTLKSNGYNEIELYYVDLFDSEGKPSTDTVVSRALSRYVRDDRYLPVSYLENIGDRPSKTFEALKNKEGVTYYAKYDNNVKFGDNAILKEEGGRKSVQGKIQTSKPSGDGLAKDNGYGGRDGALPMRGSRQVRGNGEQVA